MDVADLSTQVVRVLDLLGVAANVLLAGILAREQRFDLVGFIVLGVASGLGGGLLRDTLLQVGTPVALTDVAYLVTAIGVALFAYLVRTSGRWWLRGVRLIDAVALGTWGAVGAQRALDAGLHWLPAILLGTLTAVGGGMIRDLLVRRTPIVFGGNTLYATCATAAAAVVVLLDRLTPQGWAGATTLVAAAVGAALCLLAYRQGWRLPEARDWRPVRRSRTKDAR
ncbi:protein of unknown function UPF0126 [Beutenbergia cavernae DSM 12333]|uniref:Glycine transporter domain-containing protein n=1 Tax=Beutenbergia cavernae (strain ATCC BAA-8 / DSM 12333 / CCUG 43141 / JCM 11478 / NBRC 16432 / NCIMB 13614 / HKI 0122) TaxID=471853 RepID=C5C5L4_BEUC1|nr:TRIC cation channel family protein [Beutenbergia cavernae]ACQ80205.1 protein of unknown function UPF0126 [Beutenbergia cavernae DSM 12333]